MGWTQQGLLAQSSQCPSILGTGGGGYLFHEGLLIYSREEGLGKIKGIFLLLPFSHIPSAYNIQYAKMPYLEGSVF